MQIAAVHMNCREEGGYVLVLQSRLPTGAPFSREHRVGTHAQAMIATARLLEDWAQAWRENAALLSAAVVLDGAGA